MFASSRKTQSANQPTFFHNKSENQDYYLEKSFSSNKQMKDMKAFINNDQDQCLTQQCFSDTFSKITLIKNQSQSPVQNRRDSQTSKMRTYSSKILNNQTRNSSPEVRSNMKIKTEITFQFAPQKKQSNSNDSFALWLKNQINLTSNKASLQFSSGDLSTSENQQKMLSNQRVLEQNQKRSTRQMLNNYSYENTLDWKSSLNKSSLIDSKINPFLSKFKKQKGRVLKNSFDESQKLIKQNKKQENITQTINNSKDFKNFNFSSSNSEINLSEIKQEFCNQSSKRKRSEINKECRTKNSSLSIDKQNKTYQVQSNLNSFFGVLKVPNEKIFSLKEEDQQLISNKINLDSSPNTQLKKQSHPVSTSYRDLNSLLTSLFKKGNPKQTSPLISQSQISFKNLKKQNNQSSVFSNATLINKVKKQKNLKIFLPFKTIIKHHTSTSNLFSSQQDDSTIHLTQHQSYQANVNKQNEKIDHNLKQRSNFSCSKGNHYQKTDPICEIDYQLQINSLVQDQQQLSTYCNTEVLPTSNAKKTLLKEKKSFMNGIDSHKEYLQTKLVNFLRKISKKLVNLLQTLSTLFTLLNLPLIQNQILQQVNTLRKTTRQQHNKSHQSLIMNSRLGNKLFIEM